MQELIGQMIIARSGGYLFDHQRRYPQWEASNAQLQDWIENYNLGGVILLGGSAPELAQKVQRLQNWAKTPLFITADIEEGVGQRFCGATHFPPLMALGEIARHHLPQALDYARSFGAITAQEALSIGINWMLAPVVDVNNNPDNPVINIRAFSEQAELVSELSQAFLEGAKAFPILTTAKHFPGHGDTRTDSHLDLPVIPHTTERLAALELLPFQTAIALGVDSIMTAHLLIPAWDQNYPATLSQIILTEQLRKRLGFQGLIITDALIMGGIAKGYPPEEIAVRSLEAGADILLMPRNPVKAIEAIIDALKTGRLREERIQESLERIGKAKRKIISQESNYYNILSQEKSYELTKNIILKSLKESDLIPIKSLQNARNLVIVDDLLNADFLDRQSPSITIPKALGYQLELVDQTSLKNVRSDQPTLLQIFIRANPFRGSAGLSNCLETLYHQLVKQNNLHALVIYGSPYILDILQPQDLPWIFTYGQMAIAQKVTLKKLFKITEATAEGMDIFIDN
jgi:beta-glucosidase